MEATILFENVELFKDSNHNKSWNDEDMFDDIDDIDPTTRVSQQPHGGATTYCNMCQSYTKSDQDGCVYHQKVLDGGEEGPYLRYDEFDQDGC